MKLNIDWFYLKKPIIMLVGAILICAALALVGREYENLQHDKYQSALSTLQSTHSIYRNIVNDIDLIDQYRSLYNNYKSTGLVGEERRLSWIESLEATNDVLRLPTLSYNLAPQEEFERPKFKVKRGVAVQSSPMELSIGMLHEEDLFALLEGLRLSIKNLFTVESCDMRRDKNIERSLDTKGANLKSTCIIRWVTIDAK